MQIEFERISLSNNLCLVYIWALVVCLCVCVSLHYARNTKSIWFQNAILKFSILPNFHVAQQMKRWHRIKHVIDCLTQNDTRKHIQRNYSRMMLFLSSVDRDSRISKMITVVIAEWSQSFALCLSNCVIFDDFFPFHFIFLLPDAFCYYLHIYIYIYLFCLFECVQQQHQQQHNLANK